MDAQADKPAAAGGDPFAALKAEAQAGQAEHAAEPGQAPPGESPPIARPAQADIAMALELMRAIPWLKSRYPTAHAALTDEQIQTAAASMGAVFDKYGWTLAGLLEQFGRELKAAIVWGGMLWTLAEAAAADMEKSQGASKATSGQSGPKQPPPSPGVSIG